MPQTLLQAVALDLNRAKLLAIQKYVCTKNLKIRKKEKRNFSEICITEVFRDFFAPKMHQTPTLKHRLWLP